jgi:hypothetical protein
MDQLFTYGNLLALTGWAALLLALFLPPVRKIALGWAGLMIPLILAITYIWLLATADAKGGFGSIADVRSLFQNDKALTAGWFHYLAFDLFVGTWVVRDGVERIPNLFGRLILIPCLGLTFMFGPVGFLSYQVVRAVARRTSPAPQGA